MLSSDDFSYTIDAENIAEECRTSCDCFLQRSPQLNAIVNIDGEFQQLFSNHSYADERAMYLAVYNHFSPFANQKGLIQVYVANSSGTINQSQTTAVVINKTVLDNYMQEKRYATPPADLTFPVTPIEMSVSETQSSTSKISMTLADAQSQEHGGDGLSSHQPVNNIAYYPDKPPRNAGLYPTSHVENMDDLRELLNSHKLLLKKIAPENLGLFLQQLRDPRFRPSIRTQIGPQDTTGKYYKYEAMTGEINFVHPGCKDPDAHHGHDGKRATKKTSTTLLSAETMTQPFQTQHDDIISVGFLIDVNYCVVKAMMSQDMGTFCHLWVAADRKGAENYAKNYQQMYVNDIESFINILKTRNNHNEVLAEISLESIVGIFIGRQNGAHTEAAIEFQSIFKSFFNRLLPIVYYVSSEKKSFFSRGISTGLLPFTNKKMISHDKKLLHNIMSSNINVFNSIYEKSHDKNAIVLAAVQGGNIDFIKTLKPSCFDWSELSALDLYHILLECIGSQNKAILEIVIKYEKNFRDLSLPYVCQLLSNAINLGWLEGVTLILDHITRPEWYPANFDITSLLSYYQDNISLIYLAAKLNRTDFLELFFQYNVFCNHAKQIFGIEYCLHNKRMMRLLIQYFAQHHQRLEVDIIIKLMASEELKSIFLDALTYNSKHETLSRTNNNHPQSFKLQLSSSALLYIISRDTVGIFNAIIHYPWQVPTMDILAELLTKARMNNISLYNILLANIPESVSEVMTRRYPDVMAKPFAEVSIPLTEIYHQTVKFTQLPLTKRSLQEHTLYILERGLALFQEGPLNLRDHQAIHRLVQMLNNPDKPSDAAPVSVSKSDDDTIELNVIPDMNNEFEAANAIVKQAWELSNLRNGILHSIPTFDDRLKMLEPMVQHMSFGVITAVLLYLGAVSLYLAFDTDRFVALLAAGLLVLVIALLLVMMMIRHICLDPNRHSLDVFGWISAARFPRQAWHLLFSPYSYFGNALISTKHSSHLCQLFNDTIAFDLFDKKVELILNRTYMSTELSASQDKLTQDILHRNNELFLGLPTVDMLNILVLTLLVFHCSLNRVHYQSSHQDLNPYLSNVENIYNLHLRIVQHLYMHLPTLSIADATGSINAELEATPLLPVTQGRTIAPHLYSDIFVTPITFVVDNEGLTKDTQPHVLQISQR